MINLNGHRPMNINLEYTDKDSKLNIMGTITKLTSLF